MKNQIFKYSISVLFAVVWLIVTGVDWSYAVVLEYSLNDQEALIAFEMTENGAKRAIRSFSKSPHAHKLMHYPFLSAFFLNGRNRFSQQRELIQKGGFKQIAVQEGKRYDLMESSFQGKYAKLVLKKDGRVIDRFLLYPSAPILDASEFIDLGRRINRKGNYSFYFFENGAPSLMVLSEFEKNTFHLKRDGILFATLKLDDRGRVEEMDLASASSSRFESNRLVLRGIKSTRSEIGQRSVSLKPDEFIEVFEDASQWNKDFSRFFVKTGEGYQYITRQFDSYDITDHVVAMLKDRLISNQTITSDLGFQNLMVHLDDEAQTFSVEIRPSCTLTFNKNSQLISDFKDKIELNHLNVDFEDPIVWFIENQQYLKARLSFEYLKRQHTTRTYSVATYFQSRYRKKPDYYKFQTAGNKMIVTGFKKINFWFDKEIGQIQFEAAEFWKRLTTELERNGQTLLERVSWWFNAPGGQIGLTYKYSQPDNSSETISIDLKSEFERRHHLNPEHFSMHEFDGGVSVSGELSNSQKSVIALSDIKDMVRTNFERPSDCAREKWQLKEEYNRFFVSVVCDLVFPFENDRLEKLVEKRFNIMENLECRFAGPEEIICSFWGFEK